MNVYANPNVLLIYPKTGMDFGSTIAPPHALLSIAAPVLKAGYKVTLLDQRVHWISNQTLRKFISSELLCVALSTMTGTQISHSLDIARMIRELTGGKVPIVWGGCHPTVLPEQTASHELVDVVVVGEGDETFVDLVQTFDQKRSLDTVPGIVYKDGSRPVKTAARPLMDIEKLLPVPWELVDVEKYIHQDMYLKGSSRTLDIGQTSRGCPYQCGFCSSSAIRQRKWRPLSAAKSIDMISENVRRFNLNGIWLRDDEFYIDRNRATAICEGIIERGIKINFYTSGTRVDVFLKASDYDIRTLKRAGAHTLKFGAESGSQRILDLMNKRIKVEQTLEVNRLCRKHGIIPAFGRMIGYPTETFEDIDKTIDLGFRLIEDNPQAQLETIAIFTPIPGTPAYPLCLEHGLRPPESLEGWSEWTFEDILNDGSKNPWYTPQECFSMTNICYMSVMGHALSNIMGSLRNPFLRGMAQALSLPVSYYYRQRLKQRQYRWVPEMPLIRHLRQELFYKSDFTIF